MSSLYCAYIKLTRNPDYWKKDRPYLDGIEYTIVRNLSTAVLAFVAGKFDITFPYSLTAPLLKDVNSQMPQAIFEISPEGVSRTLDINHGVPPFDKRELRHAMALSLHRNAFINILSAGQGDIGGVMQPFPRDYGACRRRSCTPCRVTIPMCRKIGRRHAK